MGRLNDEEVIDGSLFCSGIRFELRHRTSKENDITRSGGETGREVSEPCADASWGLITDLQDCSALSDEQGREETAGAAGPLPNGCAGICRASKKWIACNMVRALVDASGDRWHADIPPS